MYKLIKYFYEMFKVIIDIVGIAIIGFAGYFTIIFFYNTMIVSPEEIQGVVIAKYTMEESNKKNKINSYNYGVIVKESDGSIIPLETTKREFDLIKEEKQYVMKIRKDKLLYALTQNGYEYLAVNEIEKDSINVTNDDIQIAMNFVNSDNKNKLIASMGGINKPTDKEKENKSNEGETPNNEENKNDEVVEEPVVEEPVVEEPVNEVPNNNNDIDELLEDLLKEPEVTEPVNPKPNDSREKIDKLEIMMSAPNIADYTMIYTNSEGYLKFKISPSKEVGKLNTEVITDYEVLTCENVSSSGLGSCVVLANDEIWTLNNLEPSSEVLVHVPTENKFRFKVDILSKEPKEIDASKYQ